jgi:hypothetical protein
LLGRPNRQWQPLPCPPFPLSLATRAHVSAPSPTSNRPHRAQSSGTAIPHPQALRHGSILCSLASLKGSLTRHRSPAAPPCSNSTRKSHNRSVTTRQSAPSAPPRHPSSPSHLCLRHSLW